MSRSSTFQSCLSCRPSPPSHLSGPRPLRRVRDTASHRSALRRATAEVPALAERRAAALVLEPQRGRSYGPFVEDGTPWEAAPVLEAVRHLLRKKLYAFFWVSVVTLYLVHLPRTLRSPLPPPIYRRQRLDGMLNFYYHEAA